MDDPPRDYNICPSCGTEFGLHDLNASIAELREAWFSTGTKWWSPTDQMPHNWNPHEQLNRLMFKQLCSNIKLSGYPGSSPTTSSDAASFSFSIPVKSDPLLPTMPITVVAA